MSEEVSSIRSAGGRRRKRLTDFFLLLSLISVSYNLTHLGLQSMKEWGMGDSLVANVLVFAESVSQNLCEEA